MAKKDLEVGLTWGRMRVAEKGEGEYVLGEYDGVRDTLTEQTYYIIRCECGKEVKVWAREWGEKGRGVRKMKDCGCGMSALDGKRIPLYLTLPALMVARVKREAGERGVTFTRQLIDLIKGGWENAADK